MPPFVKISIAFITGICLFDAISHIELHQILLYTIAISTAIASLITINQKHLSSLFILATLVSLGALSHLNSSSLSDKLDSTFRAFTGNKIRINFTVKNQNFTPFGKKFLIQIKDLNLDSLSCTPQSTYAFLYTDSSIVLNNKNYYQTSVYLKDIKPNVNPYTTNFKKIYRQQNIYFNANAIKGEDFIARPITKENLLPGTRKKFLINVKRSLRENIKNEEAYAIILALTLGDKSVLKKHTKDAFSNTGAIHILAVSGLHVGLIYSIVLSLLYWLPKNPTFKIINLLISVILILSYCYITGMGTSVTRATLMISIYLVGKSFGRFTSVYNIIGLAAFIILFFKPETLQTISFQFSFLALISILLFHKRISNLITIKSKLLDYIWQLIVVSFAAQILVAPLIIYYFNKISLLFWITGIIAVPLAFVILVGTIVFCTVTIFKISFLTTTCSYVLELATNFLIASIEKINTLPYCFIDDIMLKKTDVIYLYATIICLTVLLITKQKSLLFTLMLLITLNATSRIFSKNKSWKKKELIVYHLSNSSHVQYLKNGTVYNIIYDHNNPSKHLNTFHKYHFENDVHTITSLDPNASQFYDIHFKLGNNAFVVNPSSYSIENNEEITHIILTKELDFDINHIESGTQLILDGNLDYFYKKNIKQKITHKAIKVHDTSIAGAYQLKL